jgi:hypothetical protein
MSDNAAPDRIGMLGKNLACLSKQNPELARRIASVPPSPDLTLSLARSGAPIPVFDRDGRPVALHSRFDPIQEAVKLSAQYEKDGFFLFAGLGFGYHIEPFLISRALYRAVIVETDPGFIRSLFSMYDFSRILGDGRIVLLVDPSREELERCLREEYLPALAGTFRSVTLRSRFDLSPGFFTSVIDTVTAALTEIKADFSVQVHFGRRWFANTVRNLSELETRQPRLPSARKAVITAAGPSLENHLAMVRTERDDACLIATDTSLPALVSWGIVPDIVLSIDCQQISYRHFLRGVPSATLLVLDLASPPALGKLTERRVFCAGNHPLSRFAALHRGDIPLIDTSGGNVTHAAVSLAASIGAEEILVAGADYSYPRGKSYARGTYLYDHFGYAGTRLVPTESAFASFLFRSSDLSVERDDDGPRYRTDVLDRYRDALFDRIGSLGFAIRSGFRRGDMIRIGRTVVTGTAPADESGGDAERKSVHAGRGSAVRKPGDVLTEFTRILDSVPEPYLPFRVYLDSLAPDQRSVLMSLLPVAAWFSTGSRRSGIAEERNELDPEQPLDRLVSALGWCREYLGKDRARANGSPVKHDPSVPDER